MLFFTEVWTRAAGVAPGFDRRRQLARKLDRRRQLAGRIDRRQQLETRLDWRRYHGPFRPHSCRWDVSLARGLSPARQSARRERADSTGGDRKADPGRMSAPCRRWVPNGNAPKGRPRRRHGADQTVHLATARGPDCASDDKAQVKLCIWRHRAGQTVHSATTRCRFGRLFVARGTVWQAGCRQTHSLMSGLSPEAQTGCRPPRGARR